MKVGQKHSEETKRIISEKVSVSLIGNKRALGFKHSEETKRKISEMGKGKKRSEESKRKMSEIRKGIKFSDEHKRRISESHKGMLGYHHSEETKVKMRLSAHRGEDNPSKRPEIREKIRISQLGKKHSEETKRKISTIQKGHRPYYWKGGITPEDKKIRNSIEYSLWRESVYARDNWTCQKYRIKGGLLRAHHIQNFSQYPELRLAIDNGITLSEKAHKEFHKRYGNKNNTKEQMLEFLR